MSESVVITKSELIEGAYEHAMKDITRHRAALRVCVRALEQVEGKLASSTDRQIVRDVARLVDSVLQFEESP